MVLLFAFLTLAFFLMLIIGLITPSKAVFWAENKTRGKVLLVYGIATIASFLFLGIVSPPSEDKPIEKEFTGLVIYETIVTGDSSEAKSLAEIGIPHRTIVEFGKRSFQCTEIGGLTDGIFFKDTAKYKSWFLDFNTKIATLGKCSDLDENATDLLKKMYPYTYGTELESMDDTLTICGYKTKKYKVVHSAFVRDYATAYIWIAKDLKLPLRRYDFQTDKKRMVTPLPLSIINDIGAILKVEVKETGVLVTYTAVTIQQKDLDIFEIPDGYTISSETSK